jgi:hypothetical protein
MGATCTIDIKKALQARIDAFIPVCEQFAQEAQKQAKSEGQTDKLPDTVKGGGGSVDVAEALEFAEKHKNDPTPTWRMPWHKMTGDAYKGIKGVFIDPYQNGGEAMGFGVMHTVAYGAYLEFANDGLHAVLRPTVDSLKESFLAEAQKAFGGGA